jgi:hypothetical protein
MEKKSFNAFASLVGNHFSSDFPGSEAEGKTAKDFQETGDEAGN